MKALIYLKKRSTINWFKELRQNKIRLSIWGIYLLILILSFFTGAEIQAQVADPLYVFSTLLQPFIFSILLLNMVLIHKSALKNGPALFSAADQQFLFTAPFKPQTLLLYAMFNKLLTAFIASMTLLYQYPNLKRNLNFGPFEMLYLIFIIFIATPVLQINALLLYSLTHHRRRLRKFFTILISLLPVLYIGGFLYNYFQTADLMTALNLYFNSPLIKYFPLLGSICELLKFPLIKAPLPCIAAAIKLFAIAAGGLFIIYKREIDFYEDAIIQKDTQRTIAENEGEKEADKRGSLRLFRQRGIGGYGESVFFYKALREKSRSKHGLISSAGILILLSSLIFLFASLQSVAGDKVLLYFIVAMLTLIYCILPVSASLANFDDEFFYLLPGRPKEKMLYALLPEILIFGGYMAPSLLITAFAHQASLFKTVFVWLYLISAVAAIYGGNICIYRIFGKERDNKINLAMMLLNSLLLLPGMICTVSAIGSNNNTVAAALFLAAASLNLVILIFALRVGVKILKEGLLN